MKKIIVLSLLTTGSLLVAESFSFEESIRVISSKPEYRTVTSSTPYQECWDEHVPVSQPPVSSSGSGTVGAIIGGVAGGVLGHQVGGGTGKTAATVGGTIVGTLVGKNVAEQNTQAPSPEYRVERRCVTRYEEKGTEKFMGYKNIATYKNQTIIKYSDRPLEYIPIHVTISY